MVFTTRLSGGKGGRNALPKALPATSRDHDTHTRVRHDRIDPSGVVTLPVAGRLHHVGVGRTHARTLVVMLVDDLQVRIVNAATGELLRDLTIDPSREGFEPEPPDPLSGGGRKPSVVLLRQRRCRPVKAAQVRTGPPLR